MKINHVIHFSRKYLKIKNLFKIVKFSFNMQSVVSIPSNNSSVRTHMVILYGIPDIQWVLSCRKGSKERKQEKEARKASTKF